MRKDSFIAVSCLWLIMTTGGHAAEPNGFDVKSIPGIELWLDAEHESTNRSSADSNLDRWSDRSGWGRDAVQGVASSQPKLVHIQDDSAGRRAVIRFDGLDDHLRILEFSRRYKDFTLVMVMAPQSNSGNFRGLFALNQLQRRDYESGFTIDMNASASLQLADINLEGRGFGGARNLLKDAVPFGSLQILEAIGDSANKQVRLLSDGKPQHDRPRDEAELIADEVTIGARYHTNGPGALQVHGFLHGDVAEVILFNRLLNDRESDDLRRYLLNKHDPLKRALAAQRQLTARDSDIDPLVIVDDPPPLQMLVPGFVVRELPVELTNINNVRYRDDGKLYALGYNGNISLLSDRDGDSLEDSSSRFFQNDGRMRGPIGMAVIPPGHALLRDSDGQEIPGARGVVVASKGKVSAILDLDGDDVAEEERVIASGWQEIPQNVDAVAIAIDPADGAIYFALGTAAYNNAYLLDDAGNSSFDLASERGTVQRIAPDLSQRTTVCTGVRFIIGMEFNAEGELFGTDQEGATWLANGNPFDELLHIRPDRHYGFPPRHPKHLPNVFDQPSLFDYGPQHQSTCGMTFNLPRKVGAATFGPASWRGDALVTGESRGKLYRTRLVRDSVGEYVASNQLIGCLGMLTVDCCLTPGGELLVACHSGGPDWGTGPEGIGKLFQVRYQQVDLPQPVQAWASSPQEVRVAFDQPLDPADLKGILAQVKITYGEFVSAGDRFESIRPGYAVTQFQQSTPRFRLPVYSTSVTPDRQTLILSTAKHRLAVQYAVTLPGLGRQDDKQADDELPQHAQVDLAYSLAGVQADWTSSDGASASTHWLPHLDLTVAKQLLEDPIRSQLGEILEKPGTLKLKTLIDTRGLFVPAIQPGSSLDYDVNADPFITARTIKVSMQHAGAADAEVAEYDFGPSDDPRLIEVKLKTGPGSVQSHVQWNVRGNDDSSHTGSLALRRFLLPWAEIQQVESVDSAREIPQLAGASWGRGRRVFLSDEAGCAKCHLAGGSGGDIGPDLSNLVHRDYASVIRDIQQPSYSINPDFITYTGLLEDGRVLTGTVRSQTEYLLFGDKEGKVTKVHGDQVAELRPSTVSIMPEGIAKTLGTEKIRDLLAYLLMPPPTMPLDSPLAAPPARTRREVAGLLSGADDEPGDPRQLNILLVAGKKDHGPGEHDYPAWLRVWSELLRSEPNVTVETAMEWPTDSQIESADTIAFFQKGSWTDERADAIDAHLARGGGLVYIHWAVEGGERAPEFAKRIGLASHAAKLKYRHGPLEVGFQSGRDHPIGRNFDRVHFHDESYWLMQGDRARIKVIASGIEDDQPRPLFWTIEPSAGRVFVSIPGHYSWTFDDPLFRILLLRGIAWTSKVPVDRFNALATLGIDLTD